VANEVAVVVAHSLNTGQPTVFQTLPVGYGSLEEGIQAAQSYHRDNHAEDRNPQYRVYKATDQDGEYALVEVWDGRQEMRMTGLYKVIAGKFKRASQ
jgi:hypothetical protein